MKLFRLFSLLIVSGLALPAFGNTFHVQVLDPSFLPIDTNTPLPVSTTFQACDATYGGPLNACIYEQNDTGTPGSIISELDLSFGTPALAGVGIDCSSDGTFVNITGCNAPQPGAPVEFDIDFTGGNGIPPGTFFAIVISNDACTNPNDGVCLTPADYGTASQNFSFTSVTPEPESLVLLGSGMLLAYTRFRKSFLRKG